MKPNIDLLVHNIASLDCLLQLELFEVEWLVKKN